jgi:excinuclease UvrABC helicase subunit UvrB
MDSFKLQAPYAISPDQQQATNELLENIESGKKVYYIIKQEKSAVKNINIE